MKKNNDQNWRILSDTCKLLVFWHLVAIYLSDKPYLNGSLTFQFSLTLQRGFKVTETLQQQVVQMKAKGLTLSAIAREDDHSKVCGFQNSASLRHSRPTKDKCTRPEMMQRISMVDWFETAAGIAHQVFTEHGQDVISVLTFKSIWTESPLCSDQTSHQQNQKARLAEEHVVQTEAKWSRIHFSDESKLNLFRSDWKRSC